MRQVYCENHVDQLDHDYNLLTVDDETILVSTDSKNWTPHYRDHIVATLEDNGEGIQLRADFLKSDLTLNYHAARALAILLINNLDSKVEIRELQTIKSF